MVSFRTQNKRIFDKKSSLFAQRHPSGNLITLPFSDYPEAASFDSKRISDDSNDPLGSKLKVFSIPPVHLQRSTCCFKGFLGTRTLLYNE